MKMGLQWHWLIAGLMVLWGGHASFAQGVPEPTAATSADETAEPVDEVSAWYAEAVLRNLPAGTWLITAAGSSIPGLAEAAKERGIFLVSLERGRMEDVVALTPEVEKLGSRLIRDAWRLPMPALLCYAWLTEKPDEACAKMAFTDAPGLATLAGFEQRPAGLVWRATREPLSREALLAELERFRGLREELGEWLATTEPPEGSGAAVRRQILSAVTRVGNDLGCQLAHAGEREAAYDLFLSLTRLDPDAVSPLLNLGVLARAKVRPEEMQTVAGLLNAFHARRLQPMAPALTSGYVLDPAVYFSAGWLWAAGGLSYADDAGWTAAEAAAPNPEARAILKELREESATRQTLQVIAFTNALARTARTNPAAQTGWTPEIADEVLPAISVGLMRQTACAFLQNVAQASEEPMRTRFHFRLVDLFARLQDVKRTQYWIRSFYESDAAQSLLPEIRRTELGALTELDQFLAVRDRLNDWQTDAPAWVEPLRQALNAVLTESPDLPAVRRHLDAALAAGPDVWEILRLQIMFCGDESPEGRERVCRAAEALLKLRPNDAMALYRLAQDAALRGDKDRSLELYQKSLQERPTWYVFNDVASLLVSMERPAQALPFAQVAYQHPAGRPFANPADTLGEVMFALGRTEEALQYFREASGRIGGGHPLVSLHLAEALIRQARYEEAAQALAAVSARRDELSFADTARLDAARQALQDAEAAHSANQSGNPR